MANADVSSIYNYRELEPMLATAGQPTEEQLCSVPLEGFEVVINLALHDDPRYSLKDETGVRYVIGNEIRPHPSQLSIADGIGFTEVV